MWNHWVARTCHPHNPFQDFEFARWFWIKMMALFPDTIAAVAMPNHIHLILSKNSPKAFEKLTGLLGAASRRFSQKSLWQPIPNPAQVPDQHHLRRQVRYVALNPCRKRLCQDPMEWYWSTYREMLGAAIHRESALSNLTSALAPNPPDFKVQFHSYVSADPSVEVSGTPYPKSSKPKGLAEKSIHEILLASAGALRIQPHFVRKPGPLRHLFIHAAYRHGWNQPKVLAKICGIQTNSVHWILNKGIPSGLSAVDLCLGDLRLSASTKS